MSDDVGQRVATLYGGDLRSVIYLHENGRDVLFLRDDVEGSTERLSDAFETLMMDLLSLPADEDSYGHGPLHCVTRRFENVVELHFPLCETEGVALALDGDSASAYEPTLPKLRALLEELV